MEITNTAVGGEGEPIISQANLGKSIDYLGDGVNNDDTDIAVGMTPEQLEEFYRVYLSVESTFQAIDLLIVADITVSMSNNKDMGGRMRSEVLDEVVNGTVTSGSVVTGTGNNMRVDPDRAAAAERMDNGIVYKFLSLHPDNKVACIGFSGGYYEGGITYADATTNAQPGKDHAPITTREKHNKTWLKKADMGSSPKDCYIRVTNKSENGGTNYETPLMKAEDVLEEVKNDGNLKVMIFLTDGEPNNCFINGTIKSAYYNSSSPYHITEARVLEETTQFFKNWINSHPGVLTYIVGISSSANTGNIYNRLTQIADAAHGVYYTADTKGDLESSLEDIVNRSKLSLVQINDEISEYVEFYEDNHDLMVEMTDLNGENKVVLWKNGKSVDENNVTEDGIKIISDVVVETPTNGGPGGQIKVIYNKDCRLDGTHKFILSYNVKVSEKAKETYFAAGDYSTDRGDHDTDYKDNHTSTGKKGYHSNKIANMTYTTFGIAFEKEFPHPVAQVSTKQIQIVKIDSDTETSLEGATFQIYRQTTSDKAGAVAIPEKPSLYGIKAPGAITTNAQGKVGTELPTGNYYMHETVAPNGHFRLADPIGFEVRNNGVFLTDDGAYGNNDRVEIKAAENNTIQIRVKNQAIYELPKSGGCGIWWFTIIGAFIMTICLASLRGRNRQSESK